MAATFSQSGQQRTESSQEVGQGSLASSNASAALIVSVTLGVVGVAFACLVAVLVREVQRRRKSPIATITVPDGELTTRGSASSHPVAGSEADLIAARNWSRYATSMASPQSRRVTPGLSPGLSPPPQSASGIHLGLDPETPLVAVPTPPNLYAMQSEPQRPYPPQQRLRRLPPLALTRSMPILPLGGEIEPWRCPRRQIHQAADPYSCHDSYSSASLPAPIPESAIPVRGNTFQPIPTPSSNNSSLRAASAGAPSPFMCMPPLQRRPGQS